MNNNIAIKVENLGKKYRIGESKTGYKTARDSFSNGVEKLLKNLRRSDSAEQIRASRTDEFWALKDVSFEVKPGEVVGIIGRNGAGKSTLLKTLSRITEPSRGSIDIYGRVGSLLEVGTGFHPELSGRENTYLSGAILGMKKAEIDRHFDEIVEFAEIEKFIDTPVKHYSSGMYLRLAFAVAAHLQPEILLIDEVLAVGDAVFQKKCLGKMGDVAKQGRTVLFVSHNMSAIQELCDRGILIESGRVGFDGRAADCIGEYFKQMHLLDSAETISNNQSAPFQTTGIKINNKLMPAIKSGETFDVTLDIQAAGVRNPKIILIIENVAGQQIVHSRINSREIGLETITGKNRLKISLPGLWLSPGVYSVYFKFMISSLNGSGRFESERMLLEVRGDFDGTGKTILCPNVDWSINNSAADVSPVG